MSEHQRSPRAPVLPPPRPWEGETEGHLRAYLAGEAREEHGAWLVRELGPAVSAVFLNQRLPRQTALDLTQEALLRVFQKIDKYRFEAPFSAWVRRITVNLLLNHRRDVATRRRHLREEPLEQPVETAGSDRLNVQHPALRREPEAETAALRAELRRALGAALRELPPGMRRCVLLYARQLTYQEIADLLGISLNTVRAQISNGYRRLRPLLAPYFGEGDRATGGSRGDRHGR
jgi:RNA polymerase sigma-70 factor (ECF subfamily)